ncbi:unnamed protein product [Lepeophtheirus salmonis]|uniref:(salmon louse) hypothetical protein n=1 Tax=Lepeophtheirus salmonis TaxID=72036 RepID=A0A7R8CND1_LEPSM|nr:unnamed protein product [Lepeophtheirus salmonis]CAF2873421.1 unnamed protein product [Lepeophtheirus salmonis]
MKFWIFLCIIDDDDACDIYFEPPDDQVLTHEDSNNESDVKKTENCENLDNTRKTEGAPHKPRLDKIRSPIFLAGLKLTIKINPMMSMLALTMKRSVSERTIKRAVKFLRMKLFARGIKELLTDDIQPEKLEWGMRLLF